MKGLHSRKSIATPLGGGISQASEGEHKSLIAAERKSIRDAKAWLHQGSPASAGAKGSPPHRCHLSCNDLSLHCTVVHTVGNLISRIALLHTVMMSIEQWQSYTHYAFNNNIYTQKIWKIAITHSHHFKIKSTQYKSSIVQKSCTHCSGCAPSSIKCISYSARNAAVVLG